MALGKKQSSSQQLLSTIRVEAVEEEEDVVEVKPESNEARHLAVNAAIDARQRAADKRAISRALRGEGEGGARQSVLKGLGRSSPLRTGWTMDGLKKSYI